MMLARLLANDNAKDSSLHRDMVEFGKSSGLFSDISIRQFGKEGDPFQILVKTGGRSRNLIDVGYGVSQVLPILAEVLRPGGATTFLIQQPEVHLHPQAQAALASLLASVSQERGTQFIIETHSDYILDRLRMDVRDKEEIRADDILILYFERTKEGTKIHPIRFDEIGNVLDAPPGYRQFFLDESARSFGIV